MSGPLLRKIQGWLDSWSLQGLALPLSSKRICAGYMGTDAKTHNPVPRWAQGRSWMTRNGGIYLLPALGASHTNTPAAATRPPASFVFSEAKQVLLVCQSFKATFPEPKCSHSVPPFLCLFIAPYNSTASQPLTARVCDTSQPCPHSAHVHTHTYIYMCIHILSPTQKDGLPLFPYPSLGIPCFCQYLQTTG